MEDPETQDKPAIIPAALPLKVFAIQAKALEELGIPKQYAEMISRIGGTGGMQNFILREAHALWNDPTISGQFWHGTRLWFTIKFVLFGISVVRVLPSLLLIGFLIVGSILGIGTVAFIASNHPASVTSAAVPFSNAPEVQVEKTDLSEVSNVHTGTKLTYTAYTAPVPGEVTAKDLDFVIIKWQYDDKVARYSYEQLARDLKSGRVVISRD